MLEFGETGYAVIEFDITEKGKIVNEKVIQRDGVVMYQAHSQSFSLAHFLTERLLPHC